MSFSSGTFTINTSGQPVVTGTTISSTVFNALTADLATGLTTCLLKDGTQTVTANIPMATFKFTGLGAGAAAGDSLRYEQLFTTSAVALLGAMNWVKGANIASVTTINLTTAAGNAVHVTGTTTIAGVTLGSGMWRLVIFDDILTLTHHATNNALPGAANITTAAGDRALYWADGTTVYCALYQRASGKALAETVGLGSNTFAGAQIGTVTSLTSSAASIAINLAMNNNFSHTMTENTTLAAPSNPVAGQSGIITITQHASAAKTLAYNAFWKFAGGTIPALTTTVGAVDVFAYYVVSASLATCQLIKDVK